MPVVLRVAPPGADSECKDLFTHLDLRPQKPRGSPSRREPIPGRTALLSGEGSQLGVTLCHVLIEIREKLSREAPRELDT